MERQVEFPRAAARRRCRVGEADVRYKRNRLELRGEFAQVSIDDAERLNVTVGRLTGVSPNIARELRGFYGEGALSGLAAGPARDLVGFVRYENFDTQFRMPSGYVPLKEFDRDAWVAGATYYPDPDIAVKVDYIWQRNQSSRDHRAEQLQHRSRMVVLMSDYATWPSCASRWRPPHGRRRIGAIADTAARHPRSAPNASPSRRREIVVEAGEEIEIAAEERRHRARIPHRRHQRQRRDPEARPRRESTVTFRAPEPGRYAFECTRMCGAGHNFMRGELIVRDPSASRASR